MKDIIVEKNRYHILTIFEILSAFWTVINLLLNIYGVVSRIDLRVLAFIGFVLFCILVFIHIYSLNNVIHSKTPNIDIFENIVTEDINTWHSEIIDGQELIFVTSIFNMANIPFSNKPKYPTDKNNVDNVRAEITYLDENKKPLFPAIQGRWGSTYQPSEINLAESNKIESINFPNNGAVRWLNLLMKYPEDKYCYGYNNDSYHYPLFINPYYIIKKYRFFIKVSLLGAFIYKKEWVFEVITKGLNDTFKIKYGEIWYETKNSKASKIIDKNKK